jgi:hypothetical protein
MVDRIGKGEEVNDVIDELVERRDEIDEIVVFIATREKDTGIAKWELIYSRIRDKMAVMGHALWLAMSLNE